MSEKEKIIEVGVLKFTNPRATVRVFVAELSEEEHNRRSKRRNDTTAALLREVERVDRAKREAETSK